MARKLPRFLFSDPKNTKSKGPFIIHTLEPRLIFRVAQCPNYEPGRMTHNGRYILFFLDEIEYSEQLEEITDAIFKWIDVQVKLGEFKIPYSDGAIRMSKPPRT